MVTTVDKEQVTYHERNLTRERQRNKMSISFLLINTVLME